MNNTSRKCLAFKTPLEVLSQKTLHFKSKSTSVAGLATTWLLYRDNVTEVEGYQKI